MTVTSNYLSVPSNHLSNIRVYCVNYERNLFLESRVCVQEEQEHLLLNTIMRVKKDQQLFRSLTYRTVK